MSSICSTYALKPIPQTLVHSEMLGHRKTKGFASADAPTPPTRRPVTALRLKGFPIEFRFRI
jgi:hypothetical protein